jgi:hypothetical protein
MPALRPEPYEVVLPFQYTPGHTRHVTRVRSTLLAASVQGLREMGWEARYFAALPPERHVELRTLTAGAWVPLELGVTHYSACDAIGLTEQEMDRMGENVSLRTQRSFVGMLGRAVAGVGGTPWNVIAHVHRIYARMIDGGDHCVYRVGPKEALLVNVGCPLVEIPYFRTAMIPYYRAIVGMLASTVYANEVPRYRAPLTVGVQLSWV